MAQARIPQTIAYAFVIGLASVPAHAEMKKPAVGIANGKFDVSGGSVGLKGLAGVEGSLSLPIGHSYGVQIDTGLMKSPNSKGGGLATQFFTRDPDQYLAGITSMWVRVNGRDIWRNGVTTELYRNDYTISLSGGLQNSLGRSSGFWGAEAGYYTTDDLYVKFGLGGHSNYRSIYGGAEWRPFKDSTISTFSNIGAGNVGGGYATVGLRFSFGAGTINLKRQHREYDPQNLVSYFYSGAGGGSEIIQEINKPVIAGPAPAPACFVAGTLVLMADGRTKNIEDIAVGDILQGMDGVKNEVLKLKPSVLAERKIYALNGGKGFATDSHPFMTSTGWKAIDPLTSSKWVTGLDIRKLSIGDMLVTFDGFLKLASIKSEDFDPRTKLYNFAVSNNQTYYVKQANTGKEFLLVHNK